MDAQVVPTKPISKLGLWMRSNPGGIIVVNEHHDPSDRLIIAQAITERMPLIGSDTKFKKYKKIYSDFELIENIK